MPRRSSVGGRPAVRAAPLPQPAARAPPPASLQNASTKPAISNIGAAVADGMAWGAGNAVAHRAVDAIVGPRTIHVERVESAAPASTVSSKAAAAADACGSHMKAFTDCINSYASDISKCQFYMDMLTECRRNSGAAISA